MPATPPVRNATESARGMLPDLAAAAVRTLPRVARVIPMKPVSPERNAPAIKANVRQAPDSPYVSATAPLGLTVLVDVRNTITTSGTRMSRMVLNCRLR